MTVVKIKPLSVNRAWCGRRFKTPAYKAYEHELLLKLRPLDIPEGFLEFDAVVGYSSKAADIDNFLKPAIDVLQKKYGFNDNRIKKLNIESVLVPKGKEFISFEFIPHQKSQNAVNLLSSMGL